MSKKNKIIVIFILLSLLLITITPSYARRIKKGEPKRVIYKLIQNMRKFSYWDKSTGKAINSIIDVGELVRRAMIDHWNKMSPSKRNRLVTLLKRLIEIEGYNFARDWFIESRIIGYEKKLPYGKKIKRSIKKKKGKPKLETFKIKRWIKMQEISRYEGGEKIYIVRINSRTLWKRRFEKRYYYWRLKQKGNRLVVYRYDLQGGNLVNNYRAMFNSIIAKKGINGLIKTMADTLKEDIENLKKGKQKEF